MIISVLLAFLLIYFAIFSFGNYLAGLFAPRSKSEDKFLIGGFLGMSINAAMISIAGLLFDTNAYWLMFISGLIGLVKVSESNKILIAIFRNVFRKKVFALFLIIAIFSLASTIIFSGIKTTKGMEFQEIHDSVWHIALIKELTSNFPPHHPSFNNIELSQYHYFYDLILASISKITKTSSLVLYFQIFPVILSGLLMGVAASLGQKISKKYGAFWLVFLTTFAGSFAYLIPIFLKGNSWGESSFWVSQTFVMMVNPQVIFTLGLSYLVLLISASTISLDWKKHLLLILLIAPSIGFKSYSWLVLSIIYGAVLLWELIRNKKLRIFLFGLLYTVVSLPFVWLITGFKTGTFFYFPLWYLDSMVEISDRLNLVEWKLKENHYRFKQNWPRVWEIKIKELLIFYFGNLGIRSLFLGLLPVIWLKKFKSTEIKLLLLSLVGFAFSTIFPLLFLQRGVVWNSIQFWYYGLIFANVMAAFLLSMISSKLSKFENIIFVIIIFVIATPTYFRTLRQKLSKREILDKQVVEAVSAYRASDRILICPEGSIYYDTSVVSAISDARVYLANPGQLELVGNSLEPVAELKSIFDAGDDKKLISLIKKEQINKIICSDGNRNETIAKMIKNNPDDYFEVSNIGNSKIYDLSVE